MNELFPRCPECGGEVRLLGGTDRWRQVLRGVKVAIPDDYGIPTCTGCGEESMNIEVSEPLDRILLEKIRSVVLKWEDDGIVLQRLEPDEEVT
jgi:hypothetical protein